MGRRSRCAYPTMAPEPQAPAIASGNGHYKGVATCSPAIPVFPYPPQAGVAGNDVLGGAGSANVQG